MSVFFCILDYGNISNRLELMKVLLKYMDSSGVRKLTRNSTESNVLHLLVESELPILLKYMLRKVDLGMLGERDRSMKSAIYLAAEQCNTFISCIFLMSFRHFFVFLCVVM